MKKIKKIFIPGKIVARAITSAFKKPATIKYPKSKPDIAPSYRGRLIYSPTNCIDCMMCMRDCPTGAITIKNLGTKENKEMHAYLNIGRCIFCCQCVDTCPKKCLSFSQDIMLSKLNRDNLTIEL